MSRRLDPDWRLPTPEGITWRMATLEDTPRLLDLWDAMDRKFGGKQDRPNLFESVPVVLTLVAVEDATGIIEAAFYGETVVDWTMIGTSRRVARTIDSLHETLFEFLYERGIRVTRVLVPLAIEKHMEKLLPRLRNITQLVAQFVCTIRS
jgi:hypothetical protein